MILFYEFIEIVFRLFYMIILFILGIFLCFLGMLFYWCKRVRTVVAGWLDRLSWYIEDKLNGN